MAALSAYARARTQLDLATGQTLEANNIQIDEAKTGRVSRAPSPIPAVDPGMQGQALRAPVKPVAAK